MPSEPKIDRRKRPNPFTDLWLRVMEKGKLTLRCRDDDVAWVRRQMTWAKRAYNTASREEETRRLATSVNSVENGLCEVTFTLSTPTGDILNPGHYRKLWYEIVE